MTTEGTPGRFSVFVRNLVYPSPSGSTPGAVLWRLRKSLWFWAALVALTALAGALRFYAVIHFNYTHPDEEIARAVVVSVLKNDDSDTNWARTDVGEPFRYTEYNFSSYYLFAAAFERARGNAVVDIEHQAGALRKHLRLLSAGLGAFCILLAGLLGWRVDGWLCGLVTAALTACSVTLFQDSLYARPETFVTLLTLLFLLVLGTDRIHRGLVLTVAGFLLGVLIACKITFLIFFPFPLLLAPALLSTPKDGKPMESHLLLWTSSLAAYFVAIGVGFAIGAPYALRYPWEYVEGLVPLMKQYENVPGPNGLSTASMMARFANSFAYVTYTIGYPALLLALIGTIHTLWKRNTRLVLLIGAPLLSLLYFMQTKAFFERNFSQALPVLFLLAGLGLSVLVGFIRGPRLLRIGAAVVIFGIAAIEPVSVMSKAIDPVLDGRYQAQIAAEATALSDDGRVAMFEGWGVDRIGMREIPFCGNYMFSSRFYEQDHGLKVGSVLPNGYRVAGYIHSVFGDYPISTLQTYLAPSMIFVAPTQSSCALELAPLIAQPGEKPLHAPLAMNGGWAAAAPLSQAPESSWPWPLYSSWGGSDSNTGTLTFGPFRACGGYVLPYTIGTSHSGVSLRIAAKGKSGSQVLYEGIPPFAPGRWQQVTVHAPPGQCSEYTITATDSGPGWAQWLGVGVPVSLTSGQTSR